MKLLEVEGNIGAGKSTFLDELRDELKNPSEKLAERLKTNSVAILPEPVDDYVTILKDLKVEQFSDLRGEVLYKFQRELIRVKLLQLADTNADFVIWERGLSAFRMFTKALDDKFTDGWRNELSQMIQKSTYNPVDAETIYLRVPAATCLERIKQRGRSEEKDYTLDYLERLERLHDEKFFDVEDRAANILPQTDKLLWLLDLNDSVVINYE